MRSSRSHFGAAASMVMHSLSAGTGRDAVWPAALRPTFRLRQPARRIPWRRAVILLAVTFVAVLSAAALVPPTLPGGPHPLLPAEPPVGPAAPPAWIVIARPIQLYGLSGSPFAKLPLNYEARRRSDGVERQDVLRYGANDPAGLSLHLAIDRVPDTATPGADLVVGFARLAAADGRALRRAGLPTAMPTRFGPFDVADLTLDRSGASIPCLGFRLQGTGPVAISGLACGTEAQPVERTTLACVIDRIDLLSAGEDQRMRDVFVTAEQRRGAVTRRSCSGES